MAESFAIRLQEKMDREGGASPVDMDIVSSIFFAISAATFCEENFRAIVEYYLPPERGDIAAFTPTK